MGLDPLNLLLLAIAVVVFWKLRSVLGARTGNERPPPEPNSAAQKPGSLEPETPSGNVLRFPAEDAREPAPQLGIPEPAEPLWKGYAIEGSATAVALEAIAAADRNFTPRGFVDGAKLAYEMIVEAFARGDRPALKNLLSKDVYDGFARAIGQRESLSQKVDLKFVGIDEATIGNVSVEGRKANITMRFISELISATLSREGAIVDGDPKEIQRKTDIWTFERDLSSRDPNWKLVSTEEPA